MENFATEFITKLYGKIGDDEMKIVLDELRVFSEQYNINKKSTDIALYNEYIPYCYNVYMVSKKIEGLTIKTLELYDFHLKHFFCAMNKPLPEITTNDIRLYLYNVQSKTQISNRTLDNKRLIINTFLEWCSNEKYITSNPCKAIGSIKYEEKERKPLTAIELELVRLACETYRERALIEIFYSTGCRVSELVNLNISDIDFVNGEVYLFGKGNKYRTSYLNAKAEIMLKKYLENRTDDNPALFVTKNRPYNRISKTGVEYLIKKIGERSEIDRNLYPHLLRHTVATDLLNRGMNIEQVQKLLGHSKLETTTIYAKISQDSVRYNHRRCIA